MYGLTPPRELWTIMTLLLSVFFFKGRNGSSVYVFINQASFKQMGACEKTEHFSMIVQQETKLKAWEFLVLYEWI